MAVTSRQQRVGACHWQAESACCKEGVCQKTCIHRSFIAVVGFRHMGRVQLEYCNSCICLGCLQG